MAKIVLTAPALAQEGMDIMARRGIHLVTMLLTTSPDELTEIVAREQPVGIISRSVPIGPQTIAAAPDLRVISKYGVGYDNIDVAAATERAIPVFVTRGANSQSVAELAAGLMLAAARGLPSLDRDMHAGRWERTIGGGIELAGLKVGIVGYGAIGRRFAPIAEAIGLEVLVCDPFLTASDVPSRYLRCTELGELLASADVVSLHCPLSADTRGMIGEAELGCMKAGAILINTARGALVDEMALARSLDSGALTAAGLDAFAVEPLPSDHPLRRCRNAVLTPHAGAATGASARRTAISVVQNLLDVLDGRPPVPENLVNPEALGRSVAAGSA